MLNNRDGTDKEKPQLKVAPSGQGQMSDANSNSTINGQLKDSRSRYDKGMSLYREGKVRVGENGLFKVSGYYEADTERMTCTCPDYRTRKESCKHLFAACLFVKNRGKEKIEHLEGQGKSHVDVENGEDIGQRSQPSVRASEKPADIRQPVGKSHGAVRNGKDITKCISQSTESERSDSKVQPVGPVEAKETGSTNGTTKPFDRQATITRLAVLNTATEILKTHRKPIEYNDIVSLAAELEKWALGGAA